MKPKVMSEEFGRGKEAALALFTRLHELAVELGDPGVKEIAATLITNINAPFLFVAVGEVKSGKSSFINALLGDEVCAVAPEPCTDVIQKITYSDEPFDRSQGECLREKGRSSEILKEIAVVDTPGTNSIIERHQEITEKYIPESDLVIFVFPAHNPHTRTAWDFLNFVRADWYKKIVFILQQADRATPEEIKANKAKVKEYAGERGVTDPVIFTVSALKALKGEPDSGLEAVWEYIRSTVTGGRHYVYKLESLLGTARGVLDRAGKALDTLRLTLEKDQGRAKTIRETLARGRDAALRDTEVLHSRLSEAYLRTSTKTCRDFEDGLSVFSLLKATVRGVFSRKNHFRQWVEDLHRDFEERFSHEADMISRETSRLMAENITLFMNRLTDELKERDAEPDRDKALDLPAVSHDRFQVLREVSDNVAKLLDEDELSRRIRPQGLKKIGDRAMMGGAMTAIGAIIAGTTHAVFFDITGGVFATIGAFLAFNTLALKRRSVVRRFQDGFAKARTCFGEQLNEKLTQRIDQIYQELEQAFAPFFANILEREKLLAGLADKQDTLAKDLYEQKKHMAKMTA